MKAANWITARSFDIDSMTTNIRCILDDATQDEFETGLNWYSSARGLMDRLSVKSGRSTQVITGILAALSPETKWTANVKDTVALLKDDNAVVTTYDNNRDKAIAIKSGRLNAHSHYSQYWRKTGAFYSNILEPDVDYRVTIDRHSARIAHGYYLTGDESIRYCNTKPKYTKTEFAFRIVAGENNILVHQLQAITWLTYRRKIVPIRYQQNDINPTDIIL